MTTIAAAPVRTASPKRIGIAGLVAAAAAWVITLPPFLVRTGAEAIVVTR